MAWRLLPDPDWRFLRLLQPSWQRPAAGHGRRRLRSGLRDAAGKFACRKPTAWFRTWSPSCASVPEVESTSRRTGLQLGLAAVTEPNTGDISVKLKDKRSRGIDDIISEVRGKVKSARAGARRRLHASAAGHDRRSDRGAAARRGEAFFSGCRSAGHLGAARGGCARSNLREWQGSRWLTSKTASKTAPAGPRWSST